MKISDICYLLSDMSALPSWQRLHLCNMDTICMKLWFYSRLWALWIQLYLIQTPKPRVWRTCTTRYSLEDDLKWGRESGSEQGQPCLVMQEAGFVLGICTVSMDPLQPSGQWSWSLEESAWGRLCFWLPLIRASSMAQLVKNPSATQET